MNINCTVIIQICNFFVAWSILEKVLLKAVLKKLIFLKQAESDFLNSIEKEKQSIASLERIQKEHWHNLNNYCLQNIPSFKKTYASFAVKTDTFPGEIDSKSVNALSQNYAICIMQWLREGR